MSEEVEEEEEEAMVPAIAEVRSTATMEFFKWLFFGFGIIGFIGWLGDLISETPILYGLFTFHIYYIPYACIAFTTMLILGCVIAAKQRSSDVSNLRAQLDESTKRLAETSMRLSGTVEKLSKETMRRNKLDRDLKEAKALTKDFKAQIRKLKREIDKKDAELKATKEKLAHALSPNVTEIRGIGPKIAERLWDLGIEKVQDLLTIAPDDLAEKIGVPTRQIAQWLEQATGFIRKS
ncbi:MAG: helix-hairpin-helix domain-containing protein, partial [Candidatus Bathyarchaeia archaeon]